MKYDDDGVLTTQFPIIEKGIFQHYQTIRDQAHLIGETESRGCCYADSWSSVPFQRMPNVWLAPAATPATPEDLIAGVDDGILIEGDGSYSIDQQRYNFQFGGDAFWEIKGGKKRGMCRAWRTRIEDAGFLAVLRRHRRARLLAAIRISERRQRRTRRRVNAMSHGCSPARFRQINVILTD